MRSTSITGFCISWITVMNDMISSSTGFTLSFVVRIQDDEIRQSNLLAPSYDFHSEATDRGAATIAIDGALSGIGFIEIGSMSIMLDALALSPRGRRSRSNRALIASAKILG